MAPKYKLTYFNITGLGEPIRYLLSYGNIEFEDFRIERSEYAAKYKADQPFGLVPVLEVDGQKIHQCSAICRYLARQQGLAGKSDLDSLLIDVIVDTITDYRWNLRPIFRATTPEERDLKMFEFKTIHNPYYLDKFDKIVAENGGHFVNSQLTWADMFFAGLIDTAILLFNEPFLDPYPNLKALKEKVDNLPGIKEYRSRRPVTRA